MFKLNSERSSQRSIIHTIDCSSKPPISPEKVSPYDCKKPPISPHYDPNKPPPVTPSQSSQNNSMIKITPSHTSINTSFNKVTPSQTNSNNASFNNTSKNFSSGDTRTSQETRAETHQLNYTNQESSFQLQKVCQTLDGIDQNESIDCSEEQSFSALRISTSELPKVFGNQSNNQSKMNTSLADTSQ